jgi:hypothetical protein
MTAVNNYEFFGAQPSPSIFMQFETLVINMMQPSSREAVYPLTGERQLVFGRPRGDTEKLVTKNICGSDLHIHNGRFAGRGT